MAFAKLWNVVFGKRTAQLVDEPRQVSQPIVAASAVDLAKSPAAAGTRTIGEAPRKLRKNQAQAGKNNSSATAKKTAVEPVSVPVAQPVLRMFRRRNNAWSKLIGNLPVQSILDTNVGDGTRAVELLAAIVDSHCQPPKYVAIGMFEAAGEPLDVKTFHQKIRAAGGVPLVIPMPLVEGLKRVSQTIGTVDLVLIDPTLHPLAGVEMKRLLGRVTHQGSLVLVPGAGGRWQIDESPQRKSA